MDKFITTALGGMPLNNDDFGFIQDAWREGFQAAYSKYGVTPATAVIISGIDRTDGGANWNYTAGYAYMNGEVLRFAAASPAKEGVGEAHYLVLDSTNASTGSKLYENGSTVQTHNARKAVITNYTIGAQPTNSILYTDINLRRVANEIEEPWVNVTLSATWSGTCKLKKVGNQVFLIIDVTTTDTTAGNSELFTADIKYAPLLYNSQPIWGYGGGNETIAYIQMNIDSGNLKVSIYPVNSGTFKYSSYASQFSWRVD